MNKRKKSKIGLILLVLIMGYASWTIFNQWKLMDGLQGKIDDAKDKISQEQKLNEELKKEKENVNSKEFIEKAAREKLGMVKDGEKVFVDINQ